MPPDATAIPQPSLTLQIRLHILQPLDPLIQIPNALILGPIPQFLDGIGERKTDAVQPLEQHQIRIGQSVAVQVLPSLVLFQHVFEIAQEFGEAVVCVIARSLDGGVFLVFVVVADGNGMVGFVRFVGEAVQRGQGQLIDAVDCVCVVGGDKAESGAEIEEDVGELAEVEVAVLEDWRCEMRDVGGWGVGGGGNEGHEGFHTRVRVGVGDVGVGGRACFEAKTDGLGAAGDSRPVVEEVRRGGTGGAGPFVIGGGSHCGVLEKMVSVMLVTPGGLDEWGW